MTLSEYADLRYGLFIHYGLYSLLGRGEWVMNRERIAPAEYEKLADQFTAERFDAAEICDLAVRAGMRYVVLTTMHHEGFRLYPTRLSSYHAERDLVGEIVAAARQRDLKIGLYHSLNNWHDQPDAVAALEDPAVHEVFIRGVFERCIELAERYNPIDVFWYDGWWPFNAEGWRAEALNERLRAIQPHLLFNGRNGLAGDFGTPEGHMSSPRPWRPWEGCITLNNNWGYHVGDHQWKSPTEVAMMLVTAAQGRGNLLLNIGPRGDGSVPQASVTILETVGAWLKTVGEGIYGTDAFVYDLQTRGENDRADWSHNGPFTAKGNDLYWFVRHWPGASFVLGGLQATVREVTLLGKQGGPVRYVQDGERLCLDGLPQQAPDAVCPVLRIRCDRPPMITLGGGMRVPKVPYPFYDPCPSDIVL